MRDRIPIGIITFTIVLVLSVSPLIMPKAFRLGLLPDKGNSFGCATCHTNPAGGGARNSFGADYERVAIPAGDKYTDALAKLDSDGDGFSNEEEFAAKPVTNPGDPKSKPSAKPQSVDPKAKKHSPWGRMKVQ